jgi:hypothetical protein
LQSLKVKNKKTKSNMHGNSEQHNEGVRVSDSDGDSDDDGASDEGGDERDMERDNQLQQQNDVHHETAVMPKKKHNVDNIKKGKMSTEERISYGESVLLQLESSNLKFEKKYIARVQRWIEETRRKSYRRQDKNKSRMHSKLNKLEEKCTLFKLFIQREQNDILDKLLRQLESISSSRSKQEGYEARVSQLEVRDATAQEQFKNLIHKNKKLCDLFRKTLGSQYTDIADSESSSGSDVGGYMSSCDESESESESGRESGEGVSDNTRSVDGRDGDGGGYSDHDILADEWSYVGKRSNKPRSGSSSSSSSSSHSRPFTHRSNQRMQSSSSLSSSTPLSSMNHDPLSRKPTSQSQHQHTKNKTSQPNSPENANDVAVASSSVEGSDKSKSDTDTDSDSMDDFIASDDDHFCKYSKVKKSIGGTSNGAAGHHKRAASTGEVTHSRLNGSDSKGRGAGISSGFIIDANTRPNEDASIFGHNKRPSLHHQDKDTDSFDDKIQKVFNIFDDSQSLSSMCLISCDLLFSSELSSSSSTRTTSPLPQANASATYIAQQEYLQSLEHTHCTEAYIQSQACLKAMMDRATSEVNIQSGDVLMDVIHELFSLLASSFLSQGSSNNPTADATVIYQQLCALEVIWIQYACQSSQYCHYFLEECEQLEVFIVASSQFSEKFLKFNLFALLRRKALWLKVGMHYAARAVEKDLSGSGDSRGVMKMLVASERKIWAQVFLGK